MSGLSPLSPSHTKAICEPSGEKLGERSEPGYVVTGSGCRISGAGDGAGFGRVHTAATPSPNIAPAGNVTNHGHRRFALTGVSFDGGPTVVVGDGSRPAIARSRTIRAS